MAERRRGSNEPTIANVRRQTSGMSSILDTKLKRFWEQPGLTHLCIRCLAPYISTRAKDLVPPKNLPHGCLRNRSTKLLRMMHRFSSKPCLRQVCSRVLSTGSAHAVSSASCVAFMALNRCNVHIAKSNTRQGCREVRLLVAACANMSNAMRAESMR